MKPIIRELRPSDVDAFADLCASRMDRKEAEDRAELVAWMAFENPVSDGQPNYFVAADGDRLLGHIGRMPTDFFVEGQKQRATFAHDLFVHPDLQKGGKGFFISMRFYKALENACQNFCALIWTNEINIKLQQARKYDQLWANRYVHLISIDNKIEPLAGKLGPAVGLVKRSASKGMHLLDRALSYAATRKITEVDRFDERFDDLAERVGPRLGIAPVKNHEYLNWKYSHRPALDTAMFVAYGAPKEPRGFVVVTRSLSPGKTGTILDLCAPPDDEKTLIALVARATNFYRKLGASNVEAVATDPRIVHVLRKMLFLPRPPVQPLFILNTDKYSRPDFLRKLDNWHLCYGDSEGPH